MLQKNWKNHNTRTKIPKLLIEASILKAKGITLEVFGKSETTKNDEILLSILHLIPIIQTYIKKI